MRVFSLLLASIVVLLSSTACAVAGDPSVYRAQHEGSLVLIASPEIPNGRVLLVAHGYRPKDSPLSAELSVEFGYYRTLLDEGWVVASTSYRRNGWIIDDAIEDLVALKALVLSRHPQSAQFYLQGSSMGGQIAVRVAEAHPDLAVGVLAVGAALMSSDKLADSLTGSPRVPLIFVANQTEIKGPNAYAEFAAQKDSPSNRLPVRFRISRDGHVKVNNEELERGLQALVQWAEHDQRPQDIDATVQMKPPSTARVENGRRFGKVGRIHPVYGNLEVSLVKADLDALGIKTGDTFIVGSDCGEFSTLYGTTYGDVDRNEWLVIVMADGYLRIARNFASAAGPLCITSTGQEIYIRRKDSE